MRDVKENIKVVDEMEIIIYKHKQAHVFLEATNYFYLIYEKNQEAHSHRHSVGSTGLLFSLTFRYFSLFNSCPRP